MVAEKSPDRLPSGWTEQVKVSNGRKVKYFSNVETGQKFYSKKDVIRYVEMGNVCCDTPQPMGKQNKRRSQNETLPIIVKTNECPEWLPHGWIMELKTHNNGSKCKCYIDPASGCKFYSKPEVAQYLETVNNGITEQKKLGIGSVSNVVVESVSPDGLPPGWIKEARTRKSVNGGFQKDPYYTDPVSGYIFRSKKDALRYVETGNIKKCAIKPRKRDINDLELIRDAISSPDAFEKLRHWTARRQLFSGKESCGTSSLAEPEAESSKERQCNSVSAAAMVNSTSTVEILEEKHSLDNENEKCSKTKESSYPKTEDSKRKGGTTDFDENGSVSTPATDILREEKFPEHGMVKHSKSKNKRALSPPGRSSKRLAGLKPDMPAIFKLSERAIRAAAGEVPLQFEAESETEIVHHASVSNEAASDINPSNKSVEPIEDQAVPEDDPGRQDTKKHNDGKSESQQSRLRYPFGDSWSDPCLEFAFKTLTGAIPVEDDIAIKGCFPQQPDTAHTQREGCIALPESGLPNYLQNDVSSPFGAPEKPVTIQQSPMNPTNQPRGNVSLPSCGNVGPQQSSLEAGNKEYQTKVN